MAADGGGGGGVGIKGATFNKAGNCCHIQHSAQYRPAFFTASTIYERWVRPQGPTPMRSMPIHLLIYETGFSTDWGRGGGRGHGTTLQYFISNLGHRGLQ